MSAQEAWDALVEEYTERVWELLWEEVHRQMEGKTFCGLKGLIDDHEEHND